MCRWKFKVRLKSPSTEPSSPVCCISLSPEDTSGLLMALRTRMRNMIQDQILKPIKEPKVLILDDFTTRMVTNAMSMTEITQGCDVLAVQRVTTVPHSSNGLFSAVYFMRPTEKNIQKYIKDFSAKPNPYNNGYIFLTNTCPDGLFTMLQKSKTGKQRLKAFTELYCDYICYSENAFSFEEPSHFNTYYNPSRESERGYDSVKIATKLVTLCVQLQHFPGKIRYYNSACGRANNEIASNVKRYLSHFKKDNENFKWKSVNSTVLILDRGFDTITPVIHDLTTEALARDLLSIDVEANAQSDNRKTSYFPNQYVFSAQTGASEEKEEMIAFLDDSNILWKKIRFLNIKDSIKCIHNLILDIKQQRQLEAGKVQDLTLPELKELMKKYPEQRKLKKQVGALSSLLEAVLDGFALEQIKCEQTLATNCSKKPKDNKNWKVISELLKQDAKGELNNALNMHEKLRLLILYARSKATIQGISFRELKSRLKESDIPTEFGTIVTNLTYLGVPVIQNDSQWEKYQDQERFWKSWACVDIEKGDKVRPDYMPDFIQWCPTIYHLVKTLIETPDEMISRYPIIELWNKPLVRRRRTRSNPDNDKSSKKSRKSTVETRSTSMTDLTPDPIESCKSSFIVFVAGGLTYGEIKLATLLSKVYARTTNTAVVFGSTQILNPDDFIEKLHSLNKREPRIKNEDGNYVDLATYVNNPSH